MLNITPRAEQHVALNMLRCEWKSNRTFCLYAPVGFGKTVIAAFIIDGFYTKGMRVLMICPYTVLIEQTVTRFVQYGINPDDISVMWRDHPDYDPEKKIQIASADTLIRREIPADIDLIIIDEAHLKRKKILTMIKETEAKVIGLSGTPFAAFMGQHYETLIKPTTMRELIACGSLSDYEFYAPSVPNLSGVKKTATAYGYDYSETALSDIMGDSVLVGNIVQNWLKHGNNLPTICFCVNVKHANHIVIQFQKSGIAAEVMIADTPKDERDLIIKRFESGMTKIIVNVGVLVAGFDSDVRCVIYARPTASEIRWIQSLGRGLRSAAGKDKCVIFDHSGTVHKLGFPDAIEYDDLKATSDGMKDVARYQQERAEKLPKECPKCKFMKPAGVYECPKCGFKPLVNDDVETDEKRELTRLKGGTRTFTAEDKQSIWSQIKGYQKERELNGKPLSDGWCSHTYRDYVGVFPKGLHSTPCEPSAPIRNFIKSKFIKFAKGKAKSAPKPAQPKTTMRELIDTDFDNLDGAKIDGYAAMNALNKINQLREQLRGARA
ncbi:DEAD/DEAH box helicase [Pasteurellaceae bacterium USgator11]|nr:DEAD/DEAH box helicase [Pasteurellaceae bacterium USgator41]TNG96453.1 DEAD/DEAH box helicase [Pasteurellaceae bacterium UScroc12]TNH00465.1 DEAD/DEAH box helicase [Pasteurellaceae bacterium UScroc31]TNH01704.1 DEAD/DEAH box helicase [Pasteurellaceae bacterium USgator11]